MPSITFSIAVRIWFSMRCLPVRTVPPPSLASLICSHWVITADPTFTIPPLPGSLAVDAGSDFATNFFATDQRGLPRLSGAHVDIGAVEAQYETLVVSNTADDGTGSLRTAIADAATYFATITFASNLSGQTIALTGGELPVNKDLRIDGTELSQSVQISGSHESRVFDVASG